ncbi:MAG: hypothetical protein ACLS9K_09915 [Lachnospira eligens]
MHFLRCSERRNPERTSSLQARFNHTTPQVYSSGLRINKGRGWTSYSILQQLQTTVLLRTTDVTGVCELPAGTEMCMPGDNVEMTVELIHNVAMEQGLRFAIREGGRTVGSGAVATIIE